MQDITTVLISHWHQDHYNGLACVSLPARRKGPSLGFHYAMLPEVGVQAILRYTAMITLGTRTFAGLDVVEKALSRSYTVRSQPVVQGDFVSIAGLVGEVLWPPRMWTSDLTERVSRAIAEFDGLCDVDGDLKSWRDENLRDRFEDVGRLMSSGDVSEGAENSNHGGPDSAGDVPVAERSSESALAHELEKAGEFPERKRVFRR